MKPYLKFFLFTAILLSIAAAGNIYYEVLPGLQIKHPITGATTVTINGTNGDITTTGAISVSTNQGGTLVVSNMVANTTPVFDANIVMQPSRTSTNAIDSIRGYGTNWTVGDLGTGIYSGERKYCSDAITPWGTGDWVEWDGATWQLVRSRIAAAATLSQYMINAHAAAWSANPTPMTKVSWHERWTDTATNGTPSLMNFDGLAYGTFNNGGFAIGNHGGVPYMALSTAASSNSQANVTDFIWAPAAGDIAQMDVHVLIPSLADATDAYFFYCGLTASDSSIGPDGVIFFYDMFRNLAYTQVGDTTNNWWVRSTSGNTQRYTNDTQVTVAANTWVHLTIQKTTTYEAYFINGTIVGSNTTSVTSVPLYTGRCKLGKISATSVTPRYVLISSMHDHVRYGAAKTFWP